MKLRAKERESAESIRRAYAGTSKWFVKMLPEIRWRFQNSLSNRIDNNESSACQLVTIPTVKIQVNWKQFSENIASLKLRNTVETVS